MMQSLLCNHNIVYFTTPKEAVMHTVLKELVETVLAYVPVNPLVYIMRNEPLLWAASLLVAVTRGDRFFEIEDWRETDDNLYVDIEELYSIANVDAVCHHEKNLAAGQEPSKAQLDRQPKRLSSLLA